MVLSGTSAYSDRNRMYMITDTQMDILTGTTEFSEISHTEENHIGKNIIGEVPNGKMDAKQAMVKCEIFFLH